MDQLLLFVPFLLPVLAANLGERQRLAPTHTGEPGRRSTLDKVLRYLPYGLLIAINLGLLGISALALLNGLVQLLMPDTLDPEAMQINWLVVAITAFLTALLANLPLLPPVRTWLARWLPIDAASLVHMTALAFAVYQLGLSLGQMALIGGLENLIDPELSLSIWDVILSGIPLLLFAVAGVGLWIRRGGRGTLERLGLHWPTWRQLLVAAGITVLLLAFDFVVNWTWQEVAPTRYELLQRVSENIFGGLATTAGALALGLSAGISEELLFRGAVQPRLGLLLTTVLFAIGHLQYGLTVATLEVFVIGLVLGLVRKRSHTTVCILIHAAYNGVGTLLGTF